MGELSHNEARVVFGIWLAWLAFWLVMVVGWVMNIFDILGLIGGPINTLFILRVIGIFAFPLGAILGYFW